MRVRGCLQLDQRDYAGLPITKFAFNAYFDVSRPARTRKALLTLRRLIKGWPQPCATS